MISMCNTNCEQVLECLHVVEFYPLLLAHDYSIVVLSPHGRANLVFQCRHYRSRLIELSVDA